jgi:hypothetical protein
MRQPWAQKAVRLAIALGHDADLEVLQQFIGPEPPGGGRSPRRPLQASNATSLAQYIQWASTAVVGAASMPASQVQGAAAGNIPLPDLPPTVLDPTDDQLVTGWAAAFTVMEHAAEVASLAIRVCGGQSMLKHLPLERLYRDARLGSTMLPWSAEVCLERLGRAGLYD